MTDVEKAPVLESPEPAEWVGYLQKVTVDGRTITGQSNTTEYFKEAYNVTIPEDVTVANFDTGTSYSGCFCSPDNSTDWAEQRPQWSARLASLTRSTGESKAPSDCQKTRATAG